MLLSIFLDILTPVLALVLIGYFVGPLVRIEAQSLSRLAYYVLAPAFVFSVISTTEIQAALAVRMTFFIQIVFVGCAVAGFAVARLLRRPPQMTAAYMLVASFANIGNFGLPIIHFRLGDAGLAAATVYFVASNAVSFMIGVGVANWGRGGGPGALAAVLKTPALLALPPALLFNWAQIDLPLAMTRPVDLLAAAMVPIMLLTMGIQLANIGMPRITPDVVIASAVRLLAGPVLAVALATAFGLGGVEQGAGVLQASMPVAVFAAIIALEHDLLPDFVTTTVLFSTLTSIVTLTAVLAVV